MIRPVTLLISMAVAITAIVTPGVAAPVAAGASPRMVESSVKRLKTAKSDVDGDGRKDSIRLDQLSATKYRLKVVTAKKKSSSVTIKLDVEKKFRKDIWYGLAQLDGAPGVELILSESFFDGLDFEVFTWRSGKLVRETAPSGPDGDVIGWFAAPGPNGVQGMHFFCSAGERYVDFGRWSSDDFEAPYTALVQRSVWRSGAWQKDTSFTLTGLSRDQVDLYWFSGVSVKR